MSYYKPDRAPLLHEIPWKGECPNHRYIRIDFSPRMCIVKYPGERYTINAMEYGYWYDIDAIEAQCILYELLGK